MSSSTFASKRQTGFTLIELLVVISIISLLSTIILASVSTARARARDMVRLSDLKQLQIALEMYRVSNSQYPLSGGVGLHPFRAGTEDCLGDPNGYGYDVNGYILGLVPKYISKLPEDPAVSKPPATPRCYAYASDGTDYMITAANSEVYHPPTNLLRSFGGNLQAIAIFTPEAAGW